MFLQKLVSEIINEIINARKKPIKTLEDILGKFSSNIKECGTFS
jgi:hypothetical protein